MPMPLTELFSPACHLCPRRCGAARGEGARGVCGANDTLKVARAALHMWEEPPISGEAGSGTIFFSGCSLKCVYCQNHEISTGNFGLEISPERLVEIMLELQDQGANNINLVTATHYAHLLPAAIAAARARGLAIPIVYNTSGYERASAVSALGDLVDVWLTDFKYADAALAQSLSHIKDYPRVAVSGLAQMAREIERRGGELVDEDGLMKRGMIVRHLVLPGHADDSCRVLYLVWQTVGDVPISVMNQYTPNALMREQGGDLARAVTREEYEQVLDHADDLGFTTMFWQEGGAVDESYVREVIAVLGLEKKLDSLPGQLSGGQQQRVAIARALAAKPAILLADEPTGNLDSRTSQDVLGLMKVTGQKFAQTMVMITHNEEIAQLADRIVRIEDGRIVTR